MGLGKKAERKSNFFVTVIFTLAVIGAVMSGGGYEFGEESVTGHAVAESGSLELNYGFFGMLLAFMALVSIVAVGYVGMSDSKRERKTEKRVKTLPELAEVDAEIDELSARISEIDPSFGK